MRNRQRLGYVLAMIISGCMNLVRAQENKLPLSDTLVNGPSTPIMNAKRHRQLQQYDPVIQLIAYVTSLNQAMLRSEMELSSLRKDQLTFFFMNLSKKANESPADAQKDLTKLKSLLTSSERTVIEKIWKARDSVRIVNGAPKPAEIPPRAPTDSSGTRPRHGDLNSAIEGKKKYNPFAPDDPIAGKAVATILLALSKE